MAISPLPGSTSHGAVRSTTNQLVDVANKTVREQIAPPERPGEAPSLWTNYPYEGLPEELPGAVTSTIDTSGRTVRLSGGELVASRRCWSIENGRAYRVRYVVQRRANTPDPAGDAVIFGITYFTSSYNYISGQPSVWVQSINDLVTADNRTEVTAILSTSAGAGIQFVAPPTARFFRPYVQTMGVGSSTDVEVIEVTDVTDAQIWSPDVSAFNARLAALESANLPVRVEEIEESLDAPGVKTFITQSDAQAASVPSSVNILRIFSKTLPDFPVDALYRLTVGGDYDIQTADGKRWQVIGPRYDLAAFGVNGGNDASDDAKILRAFDRVRLGGALEIPAASFRAPPGGITRSDIYVRGSGVPQVSADGSWLIGGSRWLGRFAIDGDNLVLDDFGADAGAGVLGAAAATDAINVRAVDNFTAGTIRKNIRARNLVGLCKNNTSGVHAILMEGLDGFEFEGLKSHRGLFGTVVKGINGVVRNTKAREYGQAGLALKSDWYATTGVVDIDGVMGETTAANADGLLAVHAATASLSRWTARGINALGGRRAVILIGAPRPTGASTPYDPGPPVVPGTFPYCALSDFIISDVTAQQFSFRGFETSGALFNGRISGLNLKTTISTGTIGLLTDPQTFDLDIENVTFNGPSFNASAISLGGFYRARNITSIVGSMGTPNGINQAYLSGDAHVSVVSPYYGTLS
ncbi:MAG: hypothetical protein OJJ21_16940 [Ferrovibrio sp.]|uniref:hypothetical protein n=1 Tax=Ferrovibrio sp. TaxID=1917215 RepID=UPI002630E026|nr:hypothetical protein [Ferrovibrio sp.]MCW0235288.1 hypothetical protein [Ferrovibrio sp.]